MISFKPHTITGLEYPNRCSSCDRKFKIKQKVWRGLTTDNEKLLLICEGCYRREYLKGSDSKLRRFMTKVKSILG